MLSTINLLPKAFVNLLCKLTTGNSGPQLSCAKLVLWLHLQFLFCKLRNGVWALNFIFANSLTEGASSASRTWTVRVKNKSKMYLLLGCSKENSHPCDGQDSGNSRGRGGGCQRLWKSRREGGLNLKKSSTGIISTDSSRDSNFQFGNTSALSDPENSRNILFTYFSPDTNDNLSSFTGPFKAENANNKLPKNEPSQRFCNEEVETRDTFLLVPRPSAPPFCNFTQPR